MHSLSFNPGDQLVRAQLHHDRRQNEERASALLANQDPGPKVDYLVPIIADGDTGHGGLSAVMKLVKLFVEVCIMYLLFTATFVLFKSSLFFSFDLMTWLYCNCHGFICVGWCSWSPF